MCRSINQSFSFASLFLLTKKYMFLCWIKKKLLLLRVTNNRQHFLFIVFLFGPCECGYFFSLSLSFFIVTFDDDVYNILKRILDFFFLLQTSIHSTTKNGGWRIELLVDIGRIKQMRRILVYLVSFKSPYDSFMRKHLQHYGYFSGRFYFDYKNTFIFFVWNSKVEVKWLKNMVLFRRNHN